MTYNKLTIFTFFIACATLVHAQDRLFHLDYKWNREGKVSNKTSEAEKEILQFTEVIEFANEDDGFIEYQLYHLTEQIISESQVEKSNTKYISINDGASIVTASARVIKEDQTEMLLDQSDILTSFDEEDGMTYKYFALEGLEQGGIIDVYYVVRRPARYKGVQKFFQNEYPTQNYQFKLISPDHLDFAIRLYNDQSVIRKDTLANGKFQMSFELDSIPALLDEDQAPYRDLLKRFVYKLEKNRGTGNYHMTSYGALIQNIFKNLHGDISKSDLKTLDNLSKKAGVKSSESLEDRIRKLEFTVKEDVNVSSGNASSRVSDIVKNSSATSFGITRLFVNLFRHNGISYEIVLTCDKERQYMDPVFESYHYLTDYLIYLPDVDMYLSPDEYEYRLGIIPYVLAGNYGLFVKEVTVGSYTTGLGEIKLIPQLDYEDVRHDHEAQLRFSDDLSEIDINFKQISVGYYATGFQAFIDKIDKDRLENLAHDMISTYFKEIDIKEWSFDNGNARDVGIRPMILNCIGTTSELVEIAGDKLLLRVGDLIGQQVEIYSEEVRRLPVEDIYKRSFNRKIEIEIPDGYLVRNLEDFRMEEAFVRNDSQQMLFVSEPVIDGNKVIILLTEYYNQTRINLDDYADYRRVVNSAADFNKIKLIFEKSN